MNVNYDYRKAQAIDGGGGCSMIFEASYRRKALHSWDEDRQEAAQELREAVTRIETGARKVVAFLLTPFLFGIDRS